MVISHNVKPLDTKGVAEIEKILEYRFTSRNLLLKAFTHRSFSADQNERLEFFGDSILNFVISEALYNKFPSADEGDLTRLRSLLVRGETLANISVERGIGPYIRIGKGERNNRLAQQQSVLADVLEAIIGAMYCDSCGDIDAVRRLIIRWFNSRLHSLTLNPSASKGEKSILQEWLQNQKMALPAYSITSTSGELHKQIFKVQCRVDALKQEVSAVASSRKKAEKMAAQKMLRRLRICTFVE